MTGKSVVVIVLLLPLLPSGVEAKSLSCVSLTAKSPCSTCLEADQSQSLQCVGQCPQYYFVSDDKHNAVCVQVTAPTETTTPVPTDPIQTTTGYSTTGNSAADVTTQGSTTGLQTIDTTALTTNRTGSPDTGSATSPRHSLVRCRRCHETCKTCNGSAAEDCLTCNPDYEPSTKNGTTTCVKEKKVGEVGGVSFVIIASAAGGAVVLLVVVVVCLCCRRRRKRREQERGPGKTTADKSASQTEERREKEVESFASRSKGVEEPNHIKAQDTSPRPLSIEQDPDEITRYVPDPTVKKLPELFLTPAEQAELDSLPEAPGPPGPCTEPKPARRHEVYEIVDNTGQTIGQFTPVPTTPRPAPWEVVEPPTLPWTPRVMNDKQPVHPACGETGAVKKLPEPFLTPAEQAELDSLPEAPRPPGPCTEPKPAPCHKVYEVVDNTVPTKGQTIPVTTTPRPAPWEVVEPPTLPWTPRVMNDKQPVHPACGETGAVKERREKEVESFQSRSKGVEEPNYINVQATSPRPLSIKQDPDEVNGYVPDPTDKHFDESETGREASCARQLPWLVPGSDGNSAQTEDEAGKRRRHRGTEHTPFSDQQASYYNDGDEGSFSVHGTVVSHSPRLTLLRPADVAAQSIQALGQALPVPDEAVPVPSQALPVPDQDLPVSDKDLPELDQALPPPDQVLPVPKQAMLVPDQDLSVHLPVPDLDQPVSNQSLQIPFLALPVPDQDQLRPDENQPELDHVLPVPNQAPPVPNRTLPEQDQDLPVPHKNLALPDQARSLPIRDQSIQQQALPVTDEAIPVPNRVLPPLEHGPPMLDHTVLVPDQDLTVPGQVQVSPTSSSCSSTHNLLVPHEDSYSDSNDEPVDVANISSKSSCTSDRIDHYSLWSVYDDDAYEETSHEPPLSDGDCHPEVVPFLSHGENWGPLTASSLRREENNFCETVSRGNNGNGRRRDLTTSAGEERLDSAASCCPHPFGQPPANVEQFHSFSDPFLHGDDSSKLHHRQAYHTIGDFSTLHRRQENDTVENSNTLRQDKYDDRVENLNTLNHDQDDNVAEDLNVQQSHEGDELSEHSSEYSQSVEIDEAAIDAPFDFLSGHRYSLTKETSDHVYVNLIYSYTTSISTQTSPLDKSTPRSPCFSPDWQFCKEMTSTGGCLRGKDSDVRLEVPVEAIPSSEFVNVRGAVSVDINKVYRKFELENFEHIGSPIAEYDVSNGFQFQTPVRLFLPHFLPQGLCKKDVNVYQFTGDQFGNLALHKLQLLEKDNWEKGASEEAGNTEPEGFYFDEDGQICILTSHFSGYFCTHCRKEFSHPTLHMELYASHEERAGGGRQVKVRLELWDNRLFIKDFKEAHNTAMHQQGRELNRSNLVLMDRKTLPALAHRPHVDVTETLVGVRLEILSDDDHCNWQHKRRTGREELCFPVESTIELERFVPCACQSHIPQVVDWLLTNRSDVSVPPGDVFECLVDVGYVSSVDRNGDLPIRFLPDPRYVTIHASVSKSTAPHRTSEDVTSSYGFGELGYPTSIRNDLSAVNNQVSQTLRKAAESLSVPSLSDQQQSYSRGPGRGDLLSQDGSGQQNVSQSQQLHQMTDDRGQPQGNRTHEMHIVKVDKLVINQYPGAPEPSPSPSSSDTPDTGCGPSAAGDTPGRPASSNARDNDVSAESAWRTTGSREVNDNVMTSPTPLQLPSESRGASTSDPQLQASGASERDDSGRRADELRCPEEAEDDGIGQFKD